MEKIVEQLIAEMASMPVIDSHEHLPTEAEALKQAADVFTRIYCHYSITPAVSAGLPGDRLALKDTTIPLAERWRRFAPYRKAMEQTGYARAAQITARDLFGIEAIDDETYQELSRRLAQANKPGLYDRILKHRCNIEAVLNQGSWDDGPGGCARRVHRRLMDFQNITTDRLRKLRDDFAAPQDACRRGREFVDFLLAAIAEAGALGVKFHARLLAGAIVPTADEGEALFAKAMDGRADEAELRALSFWLMDTTFALAGARNLVVAVHCGLNWCNGVDFAHSSPLNVVPFLLRHRDTRFDLYHAGIPWVRETATIANQYPNACLDLCWCHQISPHMTEHFLNEWIDLVPLNKIIGFGGDNVMGPEKTYGVLVMARENIARALAARMVRGTLGESAAVDICRMWLYDNPKSIYGL